MSAFSSLLSVATHDVKLDFGGGAKIIKVDADDLFLRLNVENGFQDLFQKSLTYAALHRRPFSPPLETKDDRLNNMRNVCETFDVSGTQIRRLEDSGCKSIAHLALLNRAHLERILSASSSSSSANFIQHLEQVISILNHSPLEPLYSLKRYWHDRGLIISLDGGCPAKRKKDSCSYLHLERGARRRRSQQLSYPTNGLSPSPPPTPPSHPFAETSAGSSTTTTTTRILTLLTYNPQDPTPFRAKRRRPAEGRAVAKAAPPSLPEKDLSVPPPKIIATPATPIKISKRPFSTSSATHSRSNNSNSSPRTPSSKCGSYPASSQGYHGCLGCGKDTWVNEATGTLYKYCSPCYKSRGHRGSYHSSSIYSSSSGNDYSGGKSFSRGHHYHHHSSNNGLAPYNQGYSNKQNVLTCRNIALGCSLILSGAEMRKHETHCDFNVLVCPWPECSYKGTAFQLQHHLDKSHERVFIQNCPPPLPASGYPNGGGGDGGGNNTKRCQNYPPERRPEICIPVEIRQERLFPRSLPPLQNHFYSGQKNSKHQWASDFHWEPIQFDFDNCKFFQFMRRQPDTYGGGSKPRSLMYYFWLWTPSSPEIAQKYRYEVTLWNITEHLRHPPDVSRGTAQSLQHNAEVILSPMNRKNIACFHETKVTNNIKSNGLMRFEVRVWKSSNYVPDIAGRRGSK